MKKDPITIKEIEGFVQTDSDFAFEMRALAHLRLDAGQGLVGGRPHYLVVTQNGDYKSTTGY